VAEEEAVKVVVVDHLEVQEVQEVQVVVVVEEVPALAARRKALHLPTQAALQGRALVRSPVMEVANTMVVEQRAHTPLVQHHPAVLLHYTSALVHLCSFLVYGCMGPTHTRIITRTLFTTAVDTAIAQTLDVGLKSDKMILV